MTILRFLPSLATLLMLVQPAASVPASAQGTPDIRGWRTGLSLGVAHMGGDYTVGTGVGFGGAFNFVPQSGIVGIGLEYRLALFSIDGDQLVLHQATVSPRLTNTGGGWYQYLGLDGMIGIWDFNFKDALNPAISNHSQASGLGFGPSVGVGGLTFGRVGIDLSAAYGLVWFNDPRNPGVTIVSGNGRANTLRITVGLWFKPNG